MARKKGLLISPEFPRDSFWSYRYIMKYIGRKTPFPPVGLLTFAALMPEEWDFELVDLNTESPSDGQLRRRIATADAAFASAMSESTDTAGGRRRWAVTAVVPATQGAPARRRVFLLRIPIHWKKGNRSGSSFSASCR